MILRQILANTINTVSRIAAIQTAIFLCGLVAIELVLKQFFPLPPHGGAYLDANGHPVRIARDADTLEPLLDVRHVASEFAARIRTDDLGYRKMSKENPSPDFLFIGDSFTFGHGVSDEEVFSEVFCGKRDATCLNLGRSGSNTFDQVRILRHEIDARRLRPKTVVLTMLTACWLGAAGNDLGDNLTFSRSEKRSSIEPLPVVRASLAPSEIMRTLQSWLGGFETTKRILLVASSGLKQGVYACSNASELDAASNATAVALGELAQLAEQYRFQIKIVVIHAYQDLNGGFRTTEATVARALPKTVGCIPTGARFRNEHYYPYDGHFNAAGHANLAAILDGMIGTAANACASQ